MEADQVKTGEIYVAANNKSFILIQVDLIQDSGMIYATNLVTKAGINLRPDDIIYEPLKAVNIAAIQSRIERRIVHPAGL